MDGWMVWILVFPVLLAAILYLLGFLTIGSGVIAWGLKSGHSKRKILFILIGLGIIASPLIGMNIQRYVAEQKADRIQQELAEMERIDLSGRLPARFVAVGGFAASDIEFIRKTYGIRQFPDAETEPQCRTRKRNSFLYLAWGHPRSRQQQRPAWPILKSCSMPTRTGCA